jgi:putative peptidoglycan lipid II flippase
VIAWFGESARNWLDNASRIARLPDGIFGAGLGIALFPYLSEMAAAGKLDEFRKQAERILRLGLVCSIPCAALLIATPYPFVDLLFGHGKFGAEDVRQTAIMLPLFALSVVPITLQVVITRAFYAREDSITPVKVGVAAVTFGIVTNLLLGKLLGPIGPPLAMGLTSWANTLGLILIYRRTLGFADLRGMFNTAVKALAAATIAGLAAAGAVAVAPDSALLRSLLSCAVWAVVYGLLVKAIGVDEINEVLGMLKRRLSKG